MDSVDTEEATREVEQRLAQLRAGHVLITSRFANWSAAVDPLELDMLTQADAVDFLLERTPHRRQKPDDEAVAGGRSPASWAAWPWPSRPAPTSTSCGCRSPSISRRWKAKRAEVLAWHDPRLMQYPVSVAVAWETTFAVDGAGTAAAGGPVLAGSRPSHSSCSTPRLSPRRSPTLVRRSPAWRGTPWRGSTRRAMPSRSTGWCRRSPGADPRADRQTATSNRPGHGECRRGGQS